MSQTDQIKTALRSILDPETGRDLVAMGLIYDVRVTDGAAWVRMTTTTRGCPMSDLLRSGAETAVARVAGITSARVELTYDPPWHVGMMQD